MSTALFGDEVLLGSLLKARYAMVVRDYDRALELAEDAIRFEPNSSDAAYLRAEIMLDLMKNRGIPSPEFEQELLDKLQEGVEKFPRDYRFYMTLGRVLTAHYRWKRFSSYEDPALYLRQALRLMNEETGVIRSDVVDTHYQLGLWYFSRDQSYLAAESLATVCRMDNTMPWAFYYAGQACEKSGQYNSALAYLENYKALGLRDIDTSRRPLKLSTATLRGLLQPNAFNLETLRAAIIEEGARPSTYYDIALRFYRMEDLATSFQILNALDETQRTTPALNLMLRIQMELHQYKKVIQIALDLLSREKDSRKRQILVEYGAEAALLGRNAKALKSFANDYGDVQGISFRLAIYTACQEVINEGSTKAWKRFLNSGTNPEFIEFLKKEAAQKGIRGTVLEHMTQFYQVRRDWNGALVLLTSEFDTEQPPAYIWDDLADGYALAKKWKLAFRWYERILEQEPNRADILNNYGYFLTVRGKDLDRAKTMISKAVRLEPTTSAYLDSFAWVHYKTGDFLLAEHYLMKALELEPNDPEKLDHFGDVEMALGNAARAREAWSQALVLVQDQTYHLGRDRIVGMIQKLDPPGAKITQETP